MSGGDQHGVVESRSALWGDQEVALVDLLDRLLAGGVVLVGDLTISLAGVDLVRVSLRALVTSITPVERPGGTPVEGADTAVDRLLDAGPGTIEHGTVQHGTVEPGVGGER